MCTSIADQLVFALRVTAPVSHGVSVRPTPGAAKAVANLSPRLLVAVADNNTSVADAPLA
eukprot:348924-Alexandrium_andersonii.AAC.1